MQKTNINIENILEELRNRGNNCQQEAKGSPEYIAKLKEEDNKEKLRKEMIFLSQRKGYVSGIYWTLGLFHKNLEQLDCGPDQNYWDIMHHYLKNEDKTWEEKLQEWNENVNNNIIKPSDLDFNGDDDIMEEIIFIITKKAHFIRKHIIPIEKLYTQIEADYYFQEKFMEKDLKNNLLRIIKSFGFLKGLYYSLGVIKENYYEDDSQHYWDPLNNNEKLDELIDVWKTDIEKILEKVEKEFEIEWF